MTLFAWVSSIYLGCGVFFLIDATLLGHPDLDIFTPGVSMASAAYCGLMLVLLRLSRGMHRRLFLIASFPLLLSYVVRLVVLSVDQTRLVRPFGVAYTSRDVLPAILFMSLATIAFWVGTRIALSGNEQLSARRAVAIDDAIYRLRRPLIALALPLGLIAAALPTLGFVSRSQSESTGFVAVAQLLPVEVTIYLLMFLAVRHWDRLLRPEQIAIVVAISMVVLRDVVFGRRSAVFSIALVWIVTVAWSEPLSKKYPVYKVVSLVVAALIVVPSGISLVEAFRRAGNTGGSRSEALASRQQYTAANVAEFVSDSQAGLDSTLATITYTPEGLKEQLSLPGITATTLGQMTPDLVFSTDRLGLGRLFVVYYLGLPSYISTAGAWSGFGIAYALGGWLSIIAIGLWGLGIGALLRRWERSPTWGGGLSVYTISVLIVVMAKSGNMDGLLAQYFVQVIGVLGLLVVLKSVIRVRQHEGPPLPKVATPVPEGLRPAT